MKHNHLLSLWTTALLTAPFLTKKTRALYPEEAGQLDFLVATAGHGLTQFVHSPPSSSDNNVILTSDAKAIFGSSPTSCILAARSLETTTTTSPRLLWRRNVCSHVPTTQQQQDEQNRKQRHVVAAFGNHVVTVDATGLVRSWEAMTGALKWETQLTSMDADNTGLSLLAKEGSDDAASTIVQVSAMDAGPTVFLSAINGDILQEDEIEFALLRPVSTMEEENGLEASCLGTQVAASQDSQGLVAKVNGGSEQKLDFEIVAAADDGGDGDNELIAGVYAVQCSATSFTIAVSTTRSTTTVMTLTMASGSLLTTATVWSAEEGLSSISSALLLDASHFVEQDDLLSATGAGTGPAAKNLLSFSSRLAMHSKAFTNTVKSIASLFNIGGDSSSSSTGSVMMDFMGTEFGIAKMAVLLSTESNRLYGMYTSGPKRTQLKYHYDLPNGAEVAWHRLVHGAPNAAKNVRGIGGKAPSREVLVVSAIRHDDGIAHDEMDIHWMCLDGTTGQVQGRGSTFVASPVVQVVPFTTTAATAPGMGGVVGGGGACRQGALLVLQDLTTTQVIPTEDGAVAAAMVLAQGGAAGGAAATAATVPAAPTAAAASSSRNGWFAHILTKSSPASLQSVRLDAATTPNTPEITAHVAGMAQFPGESILAVAYPNREEVIQAPCNVLGDQSLLLKYLNPHLVVILTMTDDSSDDDKDAFSKAFQTVSENSAGGGGSGASSSSNKQKRKPMGAGNAAEAATGNNPIGHSLEDDPNLFVNVVDSVSGRVLYRASHTSAVLTPKPSVVVSENWIFYSYMNARTRRAEIGVLSLYEGMVDQQGLTAFTSPDQLRHFSSLDARESKPVVLAKTFALAKPVTALGVTTTRGGISGKRLILATADGQVYAADRKILEPRRPMGQVKESEKLEGLRQYSELIPLISYMSLSYTQQVQHVQHVISAPTDLESQTLVLAYGGPDLFFCRTSPSRGFDLLPDSFNRIMLSIVVVVLIGIFITLQRIVFRKTVKKGWV